MNVTHLKYFYDSVKEGSLRSAANLNNISPGAVSQAILKLEEHFNVELIHHKKNHFEVTTEGKRLYALSSNVLGAIQSIKTEMSDAKEAYKGKIHFSTQQSLASLVLAPKLSNFSKLYPEVKTSFTLGRTIDIKNQLDKRKIDFGISMDNIDYGDYAKLPLFTGQFVFFAGNKKNLDKQEFLLTENTTEVITLQQIYKQKHGKEMPVSMRVHSWSVIKKLALENYGIGFIPDYMVSKSEQKYVVKNLGLAPFKYTISCIYPQHHTLNKRTLALLALFKK